MLAFLNLSQGMKILVTAFIVLILYQFFSYSIGNKTKDELIFDFKVMFYIILILITIILGVKGLFFILWLE